MDHTSRDFPRNDAAAQVLEKTRALALLDCVAVNIVGTNLVDEIE